jgi:DNA repair protein RecO (recombination protein O)
MENRVLLQPAYVLHRRPFQNSSMLIDFFCLDYGRVRAVARGARRAGSRYRSLLQLFQPLLVSFSGKGDVKTVGTVESSVGAFELKGERLFSGLYANELLTRMLLNNVEHAPLYRTYQETLVKLAGTEDINSVLRGFELMLLDELGYGIDLEQDCVSREPIEAACQYLFTPDLGFERLDNGAGYDSETSNVFRGQHIQALQALLFCDPESSSAAKKILRMALAAHLGGRPLHSRRLFSRIA